MNIDRLLKYEPRSNYRIVDHTPEYIVIRDMGGAEFRSVTNDAERVVAELIDGGILNGNRRLYYYDSVGSLDEIVVRNGKFVGFQPGKRP